MKKEDLLAMGLTEEQADKVMDGLNGDFVTKSRFNEVNTELKAARTALSERDKQLEELKKVDARLLFRPKSPSFRPTTSRKTPTMPPSSGAEDQQRRGAGADRCQGQEQHRRQGPAG